jgi:8-oxo-dGTP diphosphatase
VVVRPAGAGAEVVIVHRPEYDDWSLPKGKCEPGESDVDCALREVSEETALECHLLSHLGTTTYQDRKGRDKVVHFWLMTVAAGELKGQSEVDVARWVSPAEALRLLTYERDRELLAPLARETSLYVVRHADAGERGAWTGSDRERPLTGRGRKQAQALADQLTGAGVQRLASSPYVRCVQTLEPLAARLQIRLEEDADLGEGHGLDGVGPLLVSGQTAAVCTHGDVLAELLDELFELGLAGPDARAPKASAWHVRAVCGLVRSAAYLPPPA